MNNDAEKTLDLYLEAALGRKAEDILVLDVRGLTSIADYFIICSGRSNRQVSAIAEYIERFLKKNKVRPISVEGKREGHWVLLDYGDVLIHVFFDETRRFYDLEGLWSDAKRLAPKKLKEHRQDESRAFDGEEIFID